MGLPQHAAFKVAHIWKSNRPDFATYTPFYDMGGLNSIEASQIYGPTCDKKMLRFRDALVLYADKRLYSTYKKELDSARPVLTSMKVIFHEQPLADIPEGELKEIIDGKTFFKVKDGQFPTYTELIQVEDRIINLNKERQLIKAEQNWKTVTDYRKFNAKYNHTYITYMLEGNDQTSIDMLSNGDLKNFGEIVNLLFSEKELGDGNLVKRWLREYGYLKMEFPYRDSSIIKKYGPYGGLALVGEFFKHYCIEGPGNAEVPDRLAGISGLLVHANSGEETAGAPKIDEKIQIVADTRAVIYEMEQAGLDEKLLAPLRALVDWAEKR